MLAQASTTITDSPGWGAAEWIALASVLVTLLGALTTLIVSVTKLRRENREQHDNNNAANAERFNELRGDVQALTGSVVKIDDKVDRLDERLDRHESLHHRGKRRW